MDCVSLVHLKAAFFFFWLGTLWSVNIQLTFSHREVIFDGNVFYHQAANDTSIVFTELQILVYHVSPVVSQTEKDEWQMEAQELLSHLMDLPPLLPRAVLFTPLIPPSLLLSLTEYFLGKLPCQLILCCL